MSYDPLLMGHTQPGPSASGVAPGLPGDVLLLIARTWGRRPRAFTRPTDDIELGEPVSMLKHKAAIQSYLDRLEECVSDNLMKFSRDKCKVLHVGRKAAWQQYRLGTDWLGSSCAGRDCRAVICSQPNVGQQNAPAAKGGNCVLGSVKRSSASR